MKHSPHSKIKFFLQDIKKSIIFHLNFAHELGKLKVSIDSVYEQFNLARLYDQNAANIEQKIVKRTRSQKSIVPQPICQVKPRLKLPSQPSSAKFLDRFILAYYVYCIFKYSFPIDYVCEYFDVKLYHPAQCYLLGRVIVYAPISKIIGFQTAVIMFMWRFIRFSSKPRFLNTIVYLLIDEETIFKQYKQLGIDCQDVGKDPRICCDHILSEKTYNNLDPVLGQAMYLRVYNSFDRVSYKLRYNRTPKAYKYLRETFASSTSIILVLMWVAPLIFCALIVSHILSETSIDEYYPSCVSIPDLQHNQIGSSSVSSSYFIYYKIAALSFDVIETIILVGETSFVCATYLNLCFLMDLDLHLYWKHVKDELISTICEFESEGIYLDKNENLFDYVKNLSKHSSRGQYLLDIAPKSEPHHEQKIAEIQSELLDFFQQVRIADSMISDVITFILTTLVMMTTTLCYFQANIPKFKHRATNILLLEAFNYGTMIFVSIFILRLERSVAKYYTEICSLMCLDNTSRKLSFMRIVDFFKIRNRSAYTIARQFPYSAAILLTAIGYTLSFPMLAIKLIENNKIKVESV